MHLWGMEFFKRVGDACGGFVVVDVKAVEKRHLQWARVLVFSNEERMPRNLHMMVGSLAYAVQLLGVFTKVVGGFSKKGLQSVEG